MRTNDIAVKGTEVVTSNSNEQIFYGLFVGTGGDLKVDMKGGGTVTLKNVADGQLLPIAVKKIHATGTTAADIVGFK